MMSAAWGLPKISQRSCVRWFERAERVSRGPLYAHILTLERRLCETKIEDVLPLVYDEGFLVYTGNEK